jgi:hypothetical protein
MAIQNIGTGISANDGTGDSIRDAFIKTNNNFTFLQSLLNNITTANLVAGGATANVTITSGRQSNWTGTIFYNGSELATVNRGYDGGQINLKTAFLETTNPTAAYPIAGLAGQDGAVQISGGLSVGKTGFFGNLNTYNITINGKVSSSGALEAPSTSITGEADVGKLTVGGGGFTTASDIDAGLKNVSGAGAIFTNLTGTLQTASQTNITRVGTLANLTIGGNIISVSNITVDGTWGHAAITGNVYANNVAITNNLKANWGSVTANLYSQHIESGVGTFANVTVQSYPSNFHVPSKGYVNSTAVAFAIGLGS